MTFPRTQTIPPAHVADSIEALCDGGTVAVSASTMGETRIAPNVRLAAYVWQPYVARLTVR